MKVYKAYIDVIEWIGRLIVNIGIGVIYSHFY